MGVNLPGVNNGNPIFFNLEQTVNPFNRNEDGTPNSPDNPAPPGSVVSLFGQGAGLLLPPVQQGRIHSLTELSTVNEPVRVWLRGTNFILPLEVTYAGSAPGVSTAVTQINIRLPEELPEGPARRETGISVFLGTPGRYFMAPDAQVTIAMR